MEEQKPGAGNEHQYYCVRKYVVEKNLIEYTLNMNPKKIDVFELVCSVVINQMRTDAANVIASDKGLSKKQKKCVKEKFLAGHYFDALAIAIALGQAKEITREQTDVERNKFIETMKKMTEDCNWCVMNKIED